MGCRISVDGHSTEDIWQAVENHKQFQNGVKKKCKGRLEDPEIRIPIHILTDWTEMA